MNKLILLFAFFLSALCLHAQDTVRVTVRAHVCQDKIQLRWATNSPSAWYYANRNGVTVERYTLVRDGKALDAPERTVLTPQPLKPRPLNDWESIAKQDNNAAIIAQALYGENFEVSGGEATIGQVIALSQEQEQRYVMSLFAADQSYPAALFAGWGYEDNTVKPDERYLYRVIPVSGSEKDKKRVLEMGSAYVGLSDYRELPRPVDLSAMWGNQTVMLTWNSQILEQTYNGYFLERSDDGKTFQPLSDIPLSNLTGGSRMFYTDSITNGQTYYYRLQGVTPFGGKGPLSDTIQGTGIPKLIYNPHITRVVPTAGGQAEITWEFDEQGNAELASFELRRSATSKGDYETVVDGISPTSRMVIYEHPQPENYFVVAAVPKVGDATLSFPVLLQMEDSIPPAIPQGLEGVVDSTGVVRLSWQPVQDADLLGYRIYRGQTRGEELIPLTDIAIQDTVYQDSIHIRNLNAEVYYAVTSLDKRYNQSAQSAVAELEKPEVIPPTAPLITACRATDNGIQLRWAAGNEKLKEFRIYRTAANAATYEEERSLFCSVAPDLRMFVDSTAVGDGTYQYEVVSVGRGGLLSEPSLAMSVKAKPAASLLRIKQFKGSRADKGIQLKWELTAKAIAISIYRKEGEEPLQLWRKVEDFSNGIVDELAKDEKEYEYMLMVKGADGKPITAKVTIK